jgi:hypothetical protein
LHHRHARLSWPEQAWGGAMFASEREPHHLDKAAFAEAEPELRTC